jgi:hypothetical protein
MGHILEETMTYDRRTVLMKVRMGMNVTLVLLLASAKRNAVAADTGEAKFSYSSETWLTQINDLKTWRERAD